MLKPLACENQSVCEWQVTKARDFAPTIDSNKCRTFSNHRPCARTIRHRARRRRLDLSDDDAVCHATWQYYPRCVWTCYGQVAYYTDQYPRSYFWVL